MRASALPTWPSCPRLISASMPLVCPASSAPYLPLPLSMRCELERAEAEKEKKQKKTKKRRKKKLGCGLCCQTPPEGDSEGATGQAATTHDPLLSGSAITTHICPPQSRLQAVLTNALTTVTRLSLNDGSPRLLLSLHECNVRSRPHSGPLARHSSAHIPDSPCPALPCPAAAVPLDRNGAPRLQA